jgi:predicted nuclease of predicted toxin-antitoxin system
MIFPEIVADESVDARIISALKAAGYILYSIADYKGGITDAEVISIALNRKAFITTEDKDFGDEIIFKKSAHYGTLLLRLHGLNASIKISLIINTLKKYNQELLYSFSVLNARNYE